MNEINIDYKIDAMLDMVSSLNNAMLKAHGKPFKWKDLKDLRVSDLILSLATNNIRFVYIDDSKK